MNLGTYELIERTEDYFIVSNGSEQIKVPEVAKGYFEPHYFVPRWATRFNHMCIEAFIEGHYEIYLTFSDGIHRKFTVYFEREVEA